MDSDGSEAISSSGSESYEFCVEGTMYMEKEGVLDPAGEAEDMAEVYQVKAERRRGKDKSERAVACLLPSEIKASGDNSI